LRRTLSERPLEGPVKGEKGLAIPIPLPRTIQRLVKP
jgi:hypothetical protein